MAFPLVERELASAGRKRSTYVLRGASIICGLAAVVYFPFHLAGSMAPFQGYVGIYTGAIALPAGTIHHPGEILGSYLVNVTTAFQVLVVVLLAPMFGAPLITREKRAGMLPLLLMADLGGWDVYWAKFLAAFLQVELLVLSTLPLQVFASFLGGVSVPGMVLQNAVLSLAALVVCAFALLSSALARTPVQAFLLTLGFVSMLAMAIVGGSLWWALGFQPAAVAKLLCSVRAPRVVQSVGAAWTTAPIAWQASLAGLALATAGAVFGAIFLLRRQAVSRGVRRDRGILAAMFGRVLRRTPPAVRIVIASTSEGTGNRSDLRLFLILILLLLALLPKGIGWLVILCVLCYSAISMIHDIRRYRALDDLLVTDLPPGEIARAILMSGLGRGGYCIPGLVVSGGAFLRYLLRTSYLVDSLWLAAKQPLDVAAVYALGVLLLGAVLGVQLFCVTALASYLGSYRRAPWRLSLVAAPLFVAIYALGSAAPLHVLVNVTTGLGHRVFINRYAHTLGVPCFVLWSILVFGLSGWLFMRLLQRRLRPAFLPAGGPKPS